MPQVFLSNELKINLFSLISQKLKWAYPPFNDFPILFSSPNIFHRWDLNPHIVAYATCACMPTIDLTVLTKLSKHFLCGKLDQFQSMYSKTIFLKCISLSVTQHRALITVWAAVDPVNNEHKLRSFSSAGADLIIVNTEVVNAEWE